MSKHKFYPVMLYIKPTSPIWEFFVGETQGRIPSGLHRLCRALFGNNSKAKEFEHIASIIPSFCGMQVLCMCNFAETALLPCSVHHDICHKRLSPGNFNEFNICIAALISSFTSNHPVGTCGITSTL